MKKRSFLTVTDQFCGAGGFSEGVVQYAKKKLSNGVEVKLAMNHWDLAIETHNTNHPNTEHVCEDIRSSEPRRFISTDFLVTSPECTNHSLAKGVKKNNHGLFEPIDAAAERSRATMWDVPRFTEVHKYNSIIVENVVDARSWVMWDAWLLSMHLLGYRHKCVYMNSMHCHPTPQSRDRMYVVFWKKGNKAPNLEIRPRGYCNHCLKETETFQSWKRSDRQWGKYKQQYIYRCPACNNPVEPYYYAAFNAIDWKTPGTRIGDREKPLSPNTIKRITFGIDRYWNNPQIITTRYSSGIDFRVKSVFGDPIPTQPGDQSHALLSPLIMNGERDANTGKKIRDGINDPWFTQATRQTGAIVMPFLIKNYGGDDKTRAFELHKTLGTITTSDHHGLFQPPLIIENHGTSNARPAADRLPCFTGVNKHAILSHESFRNFMTWYYGGNDQVSSMLDPNYTFSANDRAGLVTMGEKPRLEDCYYRMLNPQEVKVGMAFRPDYFVAGNQKDQVKQCGNAVTPPAAEDLFERIAEPFL